MKRDFLHISDFSSDEIWETLESAREIKTKLKNGENFQPFKNKSLAMIFAKPSARTRVSFEIAMHQLGGHVSVLEEDKSHLGRGEPISDTARVLSRYIDAIVYRTTAASKLYELSNYSTIPVINGLNDQTHPCQLLADIMTFEENLGIIKGKTITWCGDFNNVCRSWVQAAKILDFNFHLACPRNLIDNKSMLEIKKIQNIKIFESSISASKNTDCISTDTWFSMGQKKSQKKNNTLKPFQVNKKLLSYTKKNAIFMHCLPAHRGEEISHDILDHPKSVVWDEAENRLHTQKAVLTWCLK